jgi:hypothetical protein
MVALQIRDVPEDVRDTLAARARERGQSLQGFLLALVIREASFSKNLDLLKDIESWPGEAGPTAEDVVAERDAARAERDVALGVPPDVASCDHSATRRSGGAA